LLNDSHSAFRIIQEAEVQITSMRGRLGAIQRSQIEMQDAISIETDARSKIADVDFAAESSAFARLHLLFQSSVSVLQQSGQTRQMLLSLLQS